MKIRTHIQSGRLAVNHNQSRKLVIRTHVKSGKLAVNHSQSLA